MRSLLVLILLATSPALAAVHVIDGDTIRVDGQRVRLWGFDAPERRQSCRIDGIERPIGEEATDRLRSILAQGELRCRTRDRDRYGREVAECWAGSRSIGEMMVRSGWAWALPRYSRDLYLPAQEEANTLVAASGRDAGIARLRPGFGRTTDADRAEADAPLLPDSTAG